MNHIVHDLRTRQLGPEDNAHIKIGRRSSDDLVTAFSIQNQGRNSLLKVWIDGNYVELRPWEPPFTVGVEYPSILDTKVVITFESENQQQYAADGSQPALDAAETDITQPDCIYHSSVMIETFIKEC